MRVNAATLCILWFLCGEKRLRLVVACVYVVRRNFASIYLMLNPASGGASAGSIVRNPSAVKIVLTKRVNSRLICVRLWFFALCGCIGF